MAEQEKTSIEVARSMEGMDPVTKRRGENLGIALGLMGPLVAGFIIIFNTVTSTVENPKSIPWITVAFILILFFVPAVWFYNAVTALKIYKTLGNLAVRILTILNPTRLFHKNNKAQKETDDEQSRRISLEAKRQEETDDRVERLEAELDKFIGKERRSGSRGSSADRKQE